MASWSDIVSLILVTGTFVGVIFGIMVGVKKASEAMNNTKENLKSKGVDISGKGVSVKTSGRLDREHLIDATQRAFIKTIGASSFGTADNVGPDDENDGVAGYPDTSNPRMSTRMYRQNSSASASEGSIGKEKKGKKFGKISFTKSK